MAINQFFLVLDGGRLAEPSPSTEAREDEAMSNTPLYKKLYRAIKLAIVGSMALQQEARERAEERSS